MEFGLSMLEEQMERDLKKSLYRNVIHHYVVTNKTTAVRGRKSDVDANKNLVRFESDAAT